MRLASLLLTVLLAALLGISPARAAGARFSCTPNQTAETAQFGLLMNNTWNSQAAGDFRWNQCLLKRRVAKGYEYGWAWHWPVSPKTVYAYPELLLGISPWSGLSGGETVFPRRFRVGMAPITVSYDLGVDSAGSYNLAAEMWLTTRAPKAGRASVDSISTEVMIWSDYSDDMAKGMLYIEKARNVVIDGRLWSVYAAKNWGDASQASSQHWTYVAYIAQKKTRAIKYDVTKFLTDAVSRKLVSNGAYIASFELGLEIASGTGHAWVHQFAVKSR